MLRYKGRYSANKATTVVLADGASVVTTAFTTGSISWADVDFEPTLSGSLGPSTPIADNKLMKVTVDVATDMPGIDKEGKSLFNLGGYFISGAEHYRSGSMNHVDTPRGYNPLHIKLDMNRAKMKKTPVRISLKLS